MTDHAFGDEVTACPRLGDPSSVEERHHQAQCDDRAHLPGCRTAVVVEAGIDASRRQLDLGKQNLDFMRHQSNLDEQTLGDFPRVVMSARLEQHIGLQYRKELGRTFAVGLDLSYAYPSFVGRQAPENAAQIAPRGQAASNRIKKKARESPEL